MVDTSTGFEKDLEVSWDYVAPQWSGGDRLGSDLLIASKDEVSECHLIDIKTDYSAVCFFFLHRN